MKDRIIGRESEKEVLTSLYQPKLLYRAQLDEFAHSLRKYGETKDDPIENWFEAFHRLEALLDGKKGRTVSRTFLRFFRANQ